MAKENHFESNSGMKKIVLYIAVFLYTGLAFSQVSLGIEIEGVKKHGGKLYISLFNNEVSYSKREIYLSLVTISDKETVQISIALSTGEYLISIYQDTNSNGKLDTNMLGIPKEPFGFTNYNGTGVPGNFNKHKVLINEIANKITVHLYKL